MDRDLRGESRERREGRQLSKGRSLEQDPVGGSVGVRRTEEGGHQQVGNSGGPLRQAEVFPTGSRGQPVHGRGTGSETGEVGDTTQPGQRTVGGAQAVLQKAPPPELRVPSVLGADTGLGHGAGVKRTKRDKAESMLRNDSLSSDQSESLRPPPPRPYKSKRGLGAGGKRQTSVSSSEEEGVTTPEYSSGDESISDRGE